MYIITFSDTILASLTEKMFAGSLSITNPTPSDWAKFQSFFRYAYHMKGETWQGGSPAVKSAHGRTNYSWENDLFLAELNRRIIGVADVTMEIRIGRAIVEWFVHPAVHRKRVGRELMRYACERGRQQGAKRAHICVPEEDEFNRNFAAEMGFAQVRCFLGMEMVFPSPQDRPAASIGSVSVGHFRAGDGALLTTLQNRVFSGSWGFSPNSPEDIRYFFRVTQSKWQDILLIREEEKIIGYCWFHPVTQEGRSSEKKRWRIHMFGIDPEYQGKGWGKKLFLIGLDYLRKKEASSVELTVDSENTPAFELYKSGGFRVKSREYWYEKELL